MDCDLTPAALMAFTRYGWGMACRPATAEGIAVGAVGLLRETDYTGMPAQSACGVLNRTGRAESYR